MGDHYPHLRRQQNKPPEQPKTTRGEITEFIRGLIELGWSDAQIAKEAGCHRNYPNVVRHGRR